MQVLCREACVRRLLTALFVLAAVLVALPVHAAGPDYALPGDFSLPWECGQSYRVTWEPQGHWESGKATGIAWDIGMPEGTPLVAPVSGKAYFLTDQRPLETTYGHYVEIVDETGHWLVRLAHLSEQQSGERFVRTGDAIGFSGASGVTSAHLHLELLVRQGTEWVRPDLDGLRRVYGLSRQALFEGAYVGRDGCPTHVVLAGAVEPAASEVPLGQAVDLLVPLINQSTDPVHLDLVQVSLFSLDGSHLLAEAAGDWTLAGGSELQVSVPALPPRAGAWFVGRVSWSSDLGAGGEPARGMFSVGEAPLRLTGFAAPSHEPRVGDVPEITIRVENMSQSDVTIEGLVLEGMRPDGAPWRLSAQASATLQPMQIEQFTLVPDAPLAMVGHWVIGTVSYVQQGSAFAFAHLVGELAVTGPQLVVTAFSLYSSGEAAFVLLQVQNVGTEEAAVEALEVRGWKPNGDSFGTRLAQVAPIKPGRGALVQIEVSLEPIGGTWRFVDAGYWLGGSYYAMSLPNQPALALTTGGISAFPTPEPRRLWIGPHSIR
jgi:hypothetical protein